MRKISKIILSVLFTTVILSGCTRNHAVNSHCLIATKIDIVAQHEKALIHRHYTDPEKMESVLLYLRLLKPIGKPQISSDEITDDIFLITVHLSNGEKRYYRQAEHRYFTENDFPWFTVDPGQAAKLYTLMRHYPSDPYTNNTKGVFFEGGFLWDIGNL